MKPETFRGIAKRLFPRAEHRLRETPYAMLARSQFLAVDHHTLTRYGDGRMEIPMKVEWALYGMQQMRERQPDAWRQKCEEGR